MHPVMAMRWHDLLFAHWSIEANALRAAIPAPLELDTVDGEAWIGVVPFWMSGIRPRFCPPLPGASTFPELNLRTYVRYGSRGGVYFFSLDAAHRLAVRVARRCFGLPYFDAEMHCQQAGDWIDYSSSRTHPDVVPAEFAARYRPIGPVQNAAPGSLEYFLTERYCFFTVDQHQQVHRTDIRHEPWPLQAAEWQVERCDMTKLLGLTLPAHQPLLHFSRRLDVLAARPVRC